MADPLRHLFAERAAHQFILWVVPRRQHDHVRRNDSAVLQQRAVGSETLDVVILQEVDLALNHEIGAARNQCFMCPTMGALCVFGLTVADRQARLGPATEDPKSNPDKLDHDVVEVVQVDLPSRWHHNG